AEGHRITVDDADHHTHCVRTDQASVLRGLDALGVGWRNLGHDIHLALRVAHEAQRLPRRYIIAKHDLLQAGAAFGVPVVGVGRQHHPRRAVLRGVEPDAGEGIGADERDLVGERRVAFREHEWSGAPRARSVNDSPVAFASTPLPVTPAELIPEAATWDMEAAKLAENQAIWLREM